MVELIFIFMALVEMMLKFPSLPQLLDATSLSFCLCSVVTVTKHKLLYEY